MSERLSQQPATRADLERLATETSERAHNLHRELLQELAHQQRALAMATRTEGRHLARAAGDEATRLGQTLTRTVDGHAAEFRAWGRRTERLLYLVAFLTLTAAASALATLAAVLAGGGW